MNSQCNGTHDDLKAFQLLSEMADEQPVSQRELARRLGIALGLVNSYIKNFVAKGYVRIRNYPHNRYAYLLTPHGMAEKARLAYQHIHYFTNLYTVTRQDYLQLFRDLSRSGVGRVTFCGIDEVAEIAWLSLQEAGLEMAGAMDEIPGGGTFMGQRVENLSTLDRVADCPIVITSLKRAARLKELLQVQGVHDRFIFSPTSPVEPADVDNGQLSQGVPRAHE